MTTVSAQQLFSCFSMIRFGEETCNGLISQLSLDIIIIFKNSMKYIDIQKSFAEVVAVELLY